MKKFNINKFFTTPIGSFVKVFIGAMIVFLFDNYLSGSIMWPLDKHFIHALLKSGFVAIGPMIYNYFNPKYEGYGRRGIEKMPIDNSKK